MPHLLIKQLDTQHPGLESLDNVSRLYLFIVGPGTFPSLVPSSSLSSFKTILNTYKAFDLLKYLSYNFRFCKLTYNVKGAVMQGTDVMVPKSRTTPNVPLPTGNNSPD